MKTRSLLCALAVLAFLYGSTITPAESAAGKGGKLGYGFAPGLVAGRDYVAGQLIVGLKEGMHTQGVTQAAAAVGGQVVKEIEGTAILLGFASEEAAVAAVDTLLRRPEVAFVERNGRMRLPPTPHLPSKPGRGKQSSVQGDVGAQSVSTDPGTGHQWHHTVIRKTAALGTLTTTPPTVAVIDTGVDYTHPDLTAAGKVILGKNSVANNFDPYDDNGHGTHVAGIVAATAANGDYGEGVCPACKILAVKVLDADGSGTFFDVADGMHYAHGAATSPATRVLNMSLGGPASALIALEVDHIKAAGKALVAAAGNDNTTSTTSAFPGADPDTALRVMATEQNDCRTFFSNFSPAATPSQYNIAAPGWNILSTLPDAGFGPLSGTSMSSPVVAGAAALVWGQLPALTRDGLVARLVTNGKAISCGFAATTRRVDVRQAILGTTERAIVGRILDPFSGKAPSANTVPTNARLFVGTAQVAADGTNRGGSYEMTGLASGTSRILKGDRAGYVTAQLRPGISIASVAGPFTDALPKVRPTGNATVTLDWKSIQPNEDTPGCIDACNGWDLDLFVKTPAGAHIGIGGGDLLAAPFVKSPRDSIDDLEPLETVVIGSAAANGVYRVYVENFWIGTDSFNPSWTGSLASLQLYNGAASIGLFYAAPPAACTTQSFWHVGNLTKSGTAYTWANVNTCTNTRP